MSVENIINNPPKEFTEPCECCGVSEFQLGVKHAEERIIKLLEEHGQTTKSVAGFLGVCSCGQAIDDYQEHLIALIKEKK